MQESLMSDKDAAHPAPCACFYARLSGGREMLLVIVLLCALAKSHEALADPKCCEEFAPRPSPGTRPLSLEAPPLEKLAVREFSATEFRPRPKDSLGPTASLVEDMPALKSTTVWQRLAEYRVHNRVRLVTLWESPGSSLSIQAGKRGEPSLQWSSRTGGGAARGLLDHMISASLGSLGRTRSAGATKPAPLAAVP